MSTCVPIRPMWKKISLPTIFDLWWRSRTRTSVSGFLITIIFSPSFAATDAWSTILVSASSWLYRNSQTSVCSSLVTRWLCPSLCKWRWSHLFLTDCQLFPVWSWWNKPHGFLHLYFHSVGTVISGCSKSSVPRHCLLFFDVLDFSKLFSSNLSNTICIWDTSLDMTALNYVIMELFSHANKCYVLGFRRYW